MLRILHITRFSSPHPTISIERQCLISHPARGAICHGHKPLQLLTDVRRITREITEVQTIIIKNLKKKKMKMKKKFPRAEIKYSFILGQFCIKVEVLRTCTWACRVTDMLAHVACHVLILFILLGVFGPFFFFFFFFALKISGKKMSNLLVSKVLYHGVTQLHPVLQAQSTEITS